MRSRADKIGPEADDLLAPVRTQLPELRRLFLEVRTGELLNHPEAVELRRELVQGLTAALHLFPEGEPRRAATGALPPALGISTDLFLRLLGLTVPAPWWEQEEMEMPPVEISADTLAQIRRQLPAWRERLAWIESAEADLGARIAAIIDSTTGRERHETWLYVGRLLGLSGNCLSHIIMSRHTP